MLQSDSVPPAPRSGYSYQAILAASEKVNWRVEDIIGGDKRLDFSRPFMPEALARVEPLSFLEPEQRLALNHIRGHAYLYVFGLVEEFILPFVLDQARPHLGGDDDRVRALLRFASEEAKHIQLFKRFRQEFEAGFGTPCAVIGPPQAIAAAVLAHHPLAVALITLHIEWMSQRHYVESVKDARELCPQFSSLLRHHWMEEAQHAKIDTLMVEAMAASCGPDEVERAIDGYLAIGTMLDGGLAQQVAFDGESLQQATGRRLSKQEWARLVDVQVAANRWTFIGSGMSHPNFLATVGGISPAARAKLEQLAPTFG
jgi:hypothetical protein